MIQSKSLLLHFSHFGSIDKMYSQSIVFRYPSNVNRNHAYPSEYCHGRQLAARSWYATSCFQIHAAPVLPILQALSEVLDHHHSRTSSALNSHPAASYPNDEFTDKHGRKAITNSDLTFHQANKQTSKEPFGTVIYFGPASECMIVSRTLWDNIRESSSIRFDSKQHPEKNVLFSLQEH